MALMFDELEKNSFNKETCSGRNNWTSRLVSWNISDTLELRRIFLKW